jgi:hypothetical protein
MRLLLLLGLSACATISVAPGHAAVLLRPDGTMSVLPEGVTQVPRSSHADDFDLTQQAQGGSFDAVTADGVPVIVRDPTIVYGWIAGELVAADRELGGARPLVAALVRATIARVLASYRWDELDTAHLRAAPSPGARLGGAERRLAAPAGTGRRRHRHLGVGAAQRRGQEPPGGRARTSRQPARPR